MNAGTIECIVDEDGSFYFLEMNTRLQVEHTVTEMVTGLDLVALQIEVALGEKLALVPSRAGRRDPVPDQRRGPRAQLPPRSRARITRYQEPGGPFVRVDSGGRQGREISGDYDSMFAKLIVSGEDREQARTRMLRALDEFVVEGVPTTIPVHGGSSVQGLPGRHAHDHLAGAGTRRRRLPAHLDSAPGPRRAAGGRRTSWSRSTGGASPCAIFDERRDRRRGADVSRTRITASTCTGRSARRCRARS